ncbi:MAG: ABC-F family ATP-binding cassette domain-containing protein [Roseiflexaceae bacterium]
MTLLNVGGLTKYYGAELIFANVSFQVSKGDKVALVGLNGAGKSTVMKIIAGIETATKGGVHMARSTRVAYLAQEAKFGGKRTLMEEMHASLEHLNQLRDEMVLLEGQLGDTGHPEWEQRMERYGELSHRFEHAGGYEIEHQIERTLFGLGFSREQFDQPVAHFSGGQKTRAALAAALLSDPDLLMLDEPTNHLDLDALEWLEQFLRSWEGTLLVISHDRYFLDKVTTRTIEIAYGRLDGDYPGGYNKYLELKAARMEQLTKQYMAQQEEIARAEDFIRRFKNSTLSTQARGRERRLERLKEGWQGSSGKSETLIAKPDQQKKMSIKIGTEIRSGELVLKLDHVTVGYMLGSHPKTLFTSPDLEIQRGQRVALMGPNGSGKTTLLRTLVGEVPPIRGSVRLGHRVVLNYYAQSHEGLNPRNMIIEELRRIMPQIKENEARSLLARFLFSGDDVFKLVGDLSGGERSRVALAQLTLLGGNLLVLDEPTNHLDIDAREALEGVLNEYNGTILFVSHDRYFIDAVADTIWMVQNETIDVFRGTYTEYAELRDAKAKATQKPKGAAAPPAAPRSEPKALASALPTKPVEQKPAAKGDDREQRRRQRKLAAIEAEIAGLEADLRKLEAEIAAAHGDVKKITTLGMQHAEIQQMLNTRYDEWAAVAG